MKNGKVPTLKQRKAIEYCGLKSDNWLVSKAAGNQLHLVHRETNSKKVIPA